MSKISLESSQLKAIEFFPETNQLKVWFQEKTLKSGKTSGGNIYIYSNVTKHIYDIIIGAKKNIFFECSHGKCFHKLIRSKPNDFPYDKLK